MQRKFRCPVFPFSFKGWNRLSSCVRLNIRKARRLSSWKTEKNWKNTPVWEAEFTPAAIHKSRQHAFCSGNFYSTHYPDRQRVSGVAHVSTVRYKKSGVLDSREKKREIKQRVSCARERAAARQRVGWIFRGNPLPLTVSSPFKFGAQSLEIAWTWVYEKEIMLKLYGESVSFFARYPYVVFLGD